MPAQEELNILVRLKDFASKGFATITGAVKGLAGHVFSLRTAFIGLATGATAAAFTKFVASIDKFHEMSKVLGLSTELLSELEFAAQQTGVSFDELTTALRFATKNLAEFAQFGTGEAAKVLPLLSEGFQQAVREGKPLEELIDDLSEEFKNLDAASRVLVASKLFGRSGANLIPLFTDDIAKLRDRARELGISISGEVAAAADQFGDALTELKAAMRGLGVQGIAPLLPQLTELVTLLTEKLVGSRPAILNFFADFLDAVTTVSVQMLSAAGSVKDFIGIFGSDPMEKAQDEVESLTARLIQLQTPILSLPQHQAEVQKAIAQTSEKLKDATDKVERLKNSMARFSDLEAFEQGMRGIANELRAVATQADITGQKLEFVVPRDISDKFAVVNTEIEESIDLWDLMRKAMAAAGEAGDKTVAAIADGLSTMRFEAEKGARGMQEFSDNMAISQRQAEEFQRVNFGAGLSKGFEDMRVASEEWGIAATQAVHDIAGAISNNLTNAILAFGDGTQSLKEDFHDLARAMIADIARIIVQMLVLKAVQASIGSIGFERGGIVPGLVGGLQEGGIVQRKGLFQIAEGGRSEAVVPLPDNRSIPVRFENGGGGGGGVTINQEIIFNHSFVSPLDEKRLLERNKQTIVSAVVEANNHLRRVREGMR